MVAGASPDVSHAVTMRASSVRTTSTASSSNDDTITCSYASRRATSSTTPRTTTRSGSASGSVGKHLISTLITNPAKPLNASNVSSSVGTARHVGPNLRERVFDEEAEPLDDRVVTHDEHTVGGAAHVELDPVGAEVRGDAEGLERVLAGPSAGAAMGEDEGSAGGGRHRRPRLGGNVEMGNRFHLCARTSRSDPLPPAQNRL